MIKIKPGTTPTLIIKSDTDLSQYTDINIVVSQYPIIVIKQLKDIVIEDNYMAITLSEKETLLFKPNKKCRTETVFVDENGRVTKSVVSPILVSNSDNGGVLYSDKFRYDGSSEVKVITDDSEMAPILYKAISGIINVPYDYELLRNQPSIEGHVLIGDQTFEEIGLSPIPDGVIEDLPEE